MMKKEENSLKRERQETIEFIKILKDLSHDERMETKGYMKCLKGTKIEKVKEMV